MGEHEGVIRLILEIAGFVISFVAFAIKMNQMVNDKIEKAKEEGDTKRARLYERLDEVKTMHNTDMEKIRNEVADRFVDIKICKILHENTDRMFGEIKLELQNIREALCSMAEKMTQR